MKRVLVIVVTFNGRQWLERCLGSVTGDDQTGHRLVVDLYVFDNDSTDGSAEFVAARFPQAKLVRSAENSGFSQPNNLGMLWAMDHGYAAVAPVQLDMTAHGVLEKMREQGARGMGQENRIKGQGARSKGQGAREYKLPQQSSCPLPPAP